MSVKIQTTKQPTWYNADGDAVPFRYVPPSDRKKEVHAGAILTKALMIEKDMQDLFSRMNKAFDEIRDMIAKEYEHAYKKPKPEGKGGMTFFNFDRSIKVEAKVDECVKWDQALITEALHLFNQYINQNMTEANELIAGLVKSAFANSKGMIDTGKVFQILKYEEKIKNRYFQEACSLIKKAQSIDKTKIYMRVWEKQDDGQYRNVNLQFSNL